MDIEVSHEIIDKIEREAARELGIFLVIHMDPVETKDQRVLAVKEHVTEVLGMIDEEVSIHDFRMVDGKEQINLIFDMVVPHEYDREKQLELKKKLRAKLGEADPRYRCVITVEGSYVASAKES